MLNKLVKIEIASKRKSVSVTHELNVSIHGEILRNKGRLFSHCRSLACKTYGNGVMVKRVLDQEGNVLVEGWNGSKRKI